MIKKNVNFKFYLIPSLIIFSFLLRLATVYFVRDTHLDPSSGDTEWYLLLYNLIKYKSFSIYIFGDQLVPSVFLPPMYPFFLYLIKIITTFEETNLLYSIILIQIILSTYSIYLFYQINQTFFSDRLSLINSIIFSIFPLNVYVCGQISSANLQIVFSLLFLKFLLLIIKKQTNSNILIFSIVSGLLILTRGEFILIFALIIFFIFLNKKVKFTNLITIFVVVSLVISPYLIRNYVHFNQIFLVKSVGYNLWKGNNELSSVEGYENFHNLQFKNLSKKITNLEKNKYYEINRDDILLDAAINNLIKNPLRYTKLFFEKFFSYYFININSSYPNYYNFFHIFPIILLSVLSFPGLYVLFKINKFEHKCFGLYLFSNLILFSVFFILPRYKLTILPIQLILAAYFVIYIFKKFIKT